MNRLRSQSFLLLGLLIWLGALRPASAQDGCTVLPQGFPGRDLLQEALDDILAGACTEHDLCYRVCDALSIGLETQKALCDLNFLFDTETRCVELAAQNDQLLRDAGIDPDDFRQHCQEAMLAIYVVLASLQGPFHHDQCGYR